MVGFAAGFAICSISRRAASLPIATCPMRTVVSRAMLAARLGPESARAAGVARRDSVPATSARSSGPAIRQGSRPKHGLGLRARHTHRTRRSPPAPRRDLPNSLWKSLRARAVLGTRMVRIRDDETGDRSARRIFSGRAASNYRSDDNAGRY
jgi:hypothetical protein